MMDTGASSVRTDYAADDIAHEGAEDLGRSRIVGPNLITVEDEIHESEQYILPSGDPYPDHLRANPHPRDEAEDDTLAVDRGSPDPRSISNELNPSTSVAAQGRDNAGPLLRPEKDGSVRRPNTRHTTNRDSWRSERGALTEDCEFATEKDFQRADRCERRDNWHADAELNHPVAQGFPDEGLKGRIDRLNSVSHYPRDPDADGVINSLPHQRQYCRSFASTGKMDRDGRSSHVIDYATTGRMKSDIYSSSNPYYIDTDENSDDERPGNAVHRFDPSKVTYVRKGSVAKSYGRTSDVDATSLKNKGLSKNVNFKDSVESDKQRHSLEVNVDESESDFVSDRQRNSCTARSQYGHSKVIQSETRQFRKRLNCPSRKDVDEKLQSIHEPSTSRFGQKEEDRQISSYHEDHKGRLLSMGSATRSSKVKRGKDDYALSDSYDSEVQFSYRGKEKYSTPARADVEPSDSEYSTTHENLDSDEETLPMGRNSHTTSTNRSSSTKSDKAKRMPVQRQGDIDHEMEGIQKLQLKTDNYDSSHKLKSVVAIPDFEERKASNIELQRYRPAAYRGSFKNRTRQMCDDSPDDEIQFRDHRLKRKGEHRSNTVSYLSNTVRYRDQHVPTYSRKYEESDDEDDCYQHRQRKANCQTKGNGRYDGRYRRSRRHSSGDDSCSDREDLSKRTRRRNFDDDSDHVQHDYQRRQYESPRKSRRSGYTQNSRGNGNRSSSDERKPRPIRRIGSGTPRRQETHRTPTTPIRSKGKPERRFDQSSRQRPIIKPDKYDGRSCLETFLAKFESCSKYNQWDSVDKAAHLKASLVDGAGSMLWQIYDATYDEIVNKLRCRYGTQEQQDDLSSDPDDAKAEKRLKNLRKTLNILSHWPILKLEQTLEMSWHVRHLLKHSETPVLPTKYEKRDRIRYKRLSLLQ